MLDIRQNILASGPKYPLNLKPQALCNAMRFLVIISLPIFAQEKIVGFGQAILRE
jgi:hypothetical protein